MYLILCLVDTEQDLAKQGPGLVQVFLKTKSWLDLVLAKIQVDL